MLESSFNPSLDAHYFFSSRYNNVTYFILEVDIKHFFTCLIVYLTNNHQGVFSVCRANLTF